ncbi:hypothetical protein BRADI_3g59063v3 [Brachypodium distachyon]|uniref:Uncharacterized protein n=1 Tax=Brachypodium distachyon TaxID=15368 RepID=A0A2K2D5T8_BRADI|nr:hypothetical protein BRADI_3g59063v3 [Brachypodium distachyon]
MRSRQSTNYAAIGSWTTTGSWPRKRERGSKEMDVESTVAGVFRSHVRALLGKSKSGSFLFLYLQCVAVTSKGFCPASVC